jgi:hypothetical protein
VFAGLKRCNDIAARTKCIHTISLVLQEMKKKIIHTDKTTSTASVRIIVLFAFPLVLSTSVTPLAYRVYLTITAIVERSHVSFI